MNVKPSPTSCVYKGRLSKHSEFMPFSKKWERNSPIYSALKPTIRYIFLYQGKRKRDICYLQSNGHLNEHIDPGISQHFACSFHYSAYSSKHGLPSCIHHTDSKPILSFFSASCPVNSCSILRSKATTAPSVMPRS